MKAILKFRCLALVFIGLVCGSATAESAHTPKVGTSERTAIFDDLRASYAESRGVEARGLKFVAHFFKVNDGWACLKVTPTRDGEAIGEDGWVLLHREDGTWTDMNYFEKLGPYASDEAGDDALNMGPATVKRVLKTFDGCPADILPKK
jgi:hypothetical protein